jgi:hypothetical protein
METAMANMESLIARRLVILSLIGEYTAKGLGNCQNVATLKKELAQISFDRYKDKYPAYLFFTDEQFDEVVKRNKLVVSDIEAYTGYIPDECFKAVQNENIDKEDVRENEYDYCIERRKGYFITTSNFEADADVIKKLKEAKDNIEIEDIISIFTYQGKVLSREEWMRRLWRFTDDTSDIPLSALEYNRSVSSVSIRETLKSKNYELLFIAAPETYIKDIPVSKISRIFKVTQPQDPIIFRYVKDGVLVITFWS